MSTTGRKTFRNTILLSAFEVVNPLLSLALVGTITRRLGAEGLGSYNLVLSYFFIAHAFTSLGLSPLVTREIARQRSSAGRVFATASMLGIPVSLLVAGILIAAVRFGGYGPNITYAALLASAALVPSIIYLHAESVFIAMERVDVMVVVAVLENILRVVAGLLLLLNGFGVIALVGSFAACRAIATIGMLAYIHRTCGPVRLGIDRNVWKGLIQSIPVFGGILLTSTLYQSIDVLILSRLGSIEAVGFYTAAYRLMTIAMVVPKSFNTTIYPVLSRLFRESSHNFNRANSLSLRYLLLLLLPVAVSIDGIADSLVPLLFGPAMAPAAGALRILIWTLVPYGIARVLASLLVASDRQRFDLAVNGIALVANVGLNLVLIPRYGFIGCAWANLLSMLVFLGMQCYFLRREILGVIKNAAIVRPLLVTGALWGWFQLSAPLNLVIRLAGGGALFVLLVVLLRAVPLSELRMVLPARLASVLPQERHD